MKDIDGRVIFDFHDGRGLPPQSRTLYLGRVSSVEAVQAGLRSASAEVAAAGGSSPRAEFRDSSGRIVSSFAVGSRDA